MSQYRIFFTERIFIIRASKQNKKKCELEEFLEVAMEWIGVRTEALEG